MLKLIREFPSYFEYNSDYVNIIAYSFVTFLCIFRFLAPYLSSKFTKSYDKLTCNQKIEWNTRLTSTVFSFIVSLMCLYILVVDNGLASSPIIYDSALVNINISIVIGYVIYDMTVIVFNYRVIGDIFTLFHHCLSLFGYTYALTFSVMPYFANFRLIVELSTPLVNMRWFLYVCGYPKDSLKFFFNGISMTLIFFLVRIFSIPFYWYKVYTILDTPQWSKLKYFRHVMVLTCVCLDVINIYWFKKMFKGALTIWSTNWTYYEKHHKSQQLQKLSSYRRSLKSKLLSANVALYQSTLNGLSILTNPSRYIGLGFLDRLLDVLIRTFNDVFALKSPKSADEEESDDLNDENDQPTTLDQLINDPHRSGSLAKMSKHSFSAAIEDHELLTEDCFRN